MIILDYASGDSNTVDFQAVKTAGVSGLYLRRSSCFFDQTHNAWRLYHDPVYTRDSGLVRIAGMVVGAYMFPSFNKGAPAPSVQVANFLSAGGTVQSGQDLPVMLDVEFPGNGIQDTHQSQAEVFVLILETIRELRKHFSAVGIYTSHVQWHDSNGLGGPDHPDLDGVYLWIKTPYRLAARQGQDLWPVTPPHVGRLAGDPFDYWRVPTPWVDQSFWLQQYQGDCLGFPGVSNTVDLSLWNSLSPNWGDLSRIYWLEKKLGLQTSGTWTQKTTDALKAFQTSRGLFADAVIGPKTFAALCW
jgi:hypothetical protein